MPERKEGEESTTKKATAQTAGSKAASNKEADKEKDKAVEGNTPEDASEDQANAAAAEDTLNNPEPEDKKAATANVAEKKVKKIKVKFVQPHNFSIGTSEKIEAKKGDVMDIEPHLANKLVERQLAYIMG